MGNISKIEKLLTIKASIAKKVKDPTEAEAIRPVSLFQKFHFFGKINRFCRIGPNIIIKAMIYSHNF